MVEEKIDYNVLFKEIRKDVKLQKSDVLYGIGFVGAPGVGKSTVAKLISKKLNIPILVNDKIRRQLDEMGIDSEKNQPLVVRLASDKCRYMLENNISFILDANCAFSYKMLEEIFEKNNAKIFYIKLECDENEALKRIEERLENYGEDKENFSKATSFNYYSYLKRYKENPFPLNKIFFTVNTQMDIEKQVDKLVTSIKKELYKKIKLL